MAVVDGQPVSLPLFNLLYESRRSMPPAGQVSDRAAVDLKLAIAQQLIDDFLVERAAHRRGVDISEARTDAALKSLAATFPSNGAFDRHVATYPQQGVGLRRTVRQQLLREALAGVDRLEPITEAEARDFYEKNRVLYHVPAHLTAAEIVFPIAPGAKLEEVEAVRAKAREALAALRRPNVSFAAMARHLSSGRTAAIGGDLGKVAKESADPAAWAALSALKPGEISPVVATPAVLRILKLTARNPSVDVSFAGARAGIEETIRSQRRSARVAGLLMSVRQQARIDNRLHSRYRAVIEKAQTLSGDPLSTTAGDVSPQIPDGPGAGSPR